MNCSVDGYSEVLQGVRRHAAVASYIRREFTMLESSIGKYEQRSITKSPKLFFILAWPWMGLVDVFDVRVALGFG